MTQVFSKKGLLLLVQKSFANRRRPYQTLLKGKQLLSWRAHPAGTTRMGRAPESAVVDPDEIHLLDLNRNNNSWKSDSNWKTVAKLSTIGMFWMQNLLHLVAALS